MKNVLNTTLEGNTRKDNELLISDLIIVRGEAVLATIEANMIALRTNCLVQSQNKCGLCNVCDGDILNRKCDMNVLYVYGSLSSSMIEQAFKDFYSTIDAKNSLKKHFIIIEDMHRLTASTRELIINLISNKEVNAQVIVITEEDRDLNHLSINEDFYFLFLYLKKKMLMIT